MKLQQVAMLSTLILVGIAASPVNAEVVKPSDVKWVDNPALPKGAKSAVIMGDPKQGPFVSRVKFPANYKYPAHTHPDARTITVLSGTVYFGEGDKFDAKKLQALPAGTFRSEAAKSPHFLSTKGEVVLQVTATGPTGTDYVNPADDPRKK